MTRVKVIGKCGRPKASSSFSVSLLGIGGFNTFFDRQYAANNILTTV